MNRWGKLLHYKKANFNTITDIYPLQSHTTAINKSKLYNIYIYIYMYINFLKVVNLTLSH